MQSMSNTTPALPISSARPGLAVVLLFDAITCAAMGAALLAVTQPIAAMLGLPAALLTWAGVLLLACAVPMVIAGRQRPPAVWLVMLIVIGNLAWVLASVYMAFATQGITLLGRAFVIAQAMVVLTLAWLEWRGLAGQRR